MAVYTTITINDNVLSTLPNHPMEFVKNITRACEGYYYKVGQDSFRLGVDVPYVKVQKPRNFSDKTVFVYDKGELTEMNSNSQLTNELKVININEYNNLLEILQNTVLELGGEVKQISNVTSSGQEIIFEPIINSGELETEEVINSSEKEPDQIASGFFVDDLLIAKWLKDNKIPTTVAKLKKLKVVKK